MGTRSNRLAEAVLTSAHNLCFEQKYEKYRRFFFYLKIFSFLQEKFSKYLIRRVFVMHGKRATGVRVISFTVSELRSQPKRLRFLTNYSKPSLNYDSFRWTVTNIRKLHITKTCLFKYTNWNILPPKMKISDKNSDILHISTQTKYRLWVLVRTTSARRF